MMLFRFHFAPFSFAIFTRAIAASADISSLRFFDCFLHFAIFIFFHFYDYFIFIYAILLLFGFRH
jgi:hypothetical protein